MNVCACKRVTDVGIQWLCVENNLEKVKGKSGQCKAIIRLNVCMTQITKDGIKTALKNLPSLRAILHDCNIFEVLVELTRTALDQKQKRAPFSLSWLIVYGTFLSSCLKYDLGLTSSMCPFLLKIDMVLEKGLKDIDLQCLTSLKMLREINFYRKKGEEREETDITFDGGVGKLLKKIGRSLEKLSLSVFDVVNISTIIELCPNLSILSIHHTSDSGHKELTEEEISRFRLEWNKDNKQILKNLTVLNCGYNIPPDLLLWMLSFPSLEDIKIFFCNSLTDELIQNSAKHRRLQNLKLFMLLRCHSVSSKGIDALMVDGNSLNQVFFVFCNRLTIKNVSDWHKRACQKNWELYLYLQESNTYNVARFGEIEKR